MIINFLFYNNLIKIINSENIASKRALFIQFFLKIIV